MVRLFIKANDANEKDSFKIFNQSGKELFYTKDDFQTTGHRIKIYLADTISEVGYVQEKTGTGAARFEFAARDNFGNVTISKGSSNADVNIDFNGWKLQGLPFEWHYDVYMGQTPVMAARHGMFMIPGQALNICDTYVITVATDSETTICTAFALALFAAKKYHVVF